MRSCCQTILQQQRVLQLHQIVRGLTLAISLRHNSDSSSPMRMLWHDHLQEYTLTPLHTVPPHPSNAESLNLDLYNSSFSIIDQREFEQLSSILNMNSSDASI